MEFVSNEIKRFRTNARNRVSNKIERSEIKAGDHIYTYRTMYAYAHHGIYVGDGNVIHYTSHKGNKSSNTPKSEVIITSLDVFLRNGDLYRYEYGVTKDKLMDQSRGGCCTIATSDVADTVIHRANYLLKQNGFGKYSLTNNNCEDFSLYCKTGLRIIGTTQMRSSGQVLATISCLFVCLMLLGPLLQVAALTLTRVALSLPQVVLLLIALLQIALNLVPWLRKVAGRSPRFRFQWRLDADIGCRNDVEKVRVEDLADAMVNHHLIL